MQGFTEGTCEQARNLIGTKFQSIGTVHTINNFHMACDTLNQVFLRYKLTQVNTNLDMMLSDSSVNLRLNFETYNIFWG
jgi:hypothetical protein